MQFFGKVDRFASEGSLELISGKWMPILKYQGRYISSLDFVVTRFWIKFSKANSVNIADK